MQGLRLHFPLPMRVFFALLVAITAAAPVYAQTPPVQTPPVAAPAAPAARTFTVAARTDQLPPGPL